MQDKTEHEPRLGMITGRITLRDDRGSHDLRAAVWSGLHEELLDDLSVIEHDATSMLLVEKNAIMGRLREDAFATTSRCVLLCGNGYPSRMFRRLARRRHDQARLPFYVLADNDPAGYELFFLMARGPSGSTEAAKAEAITSAGFLGLRVRDYESLGLGDWAQIPLSAAERDHLLRLKTATWLQSDLAWQNELDALLQRGFKVEMEALGGVSRSFLAETYLPERLAAVDHLRMPAAPRREA